MMSTTSETAALQRQILLVGPYGVLGTGISDAVAEHNQDPPGGFADCIDSHQSFRRQLTRLRELHIIP